MTICFKCLRQNGLVVDHVVGNDADPDSGSRQWKVILCNRFDVL